jgi:hypothetical protein
MSKLIAQGERRGPQGDTRAADGDALTAPQEAVPTKSDTGPSLRDCARVFARQPSPPYLLGALVLALAARAIQGEFSWRDLVMVAGLLAWFGVTSTVGDRVIGTLADQRSIPRSATARSLHSDS